MDNDSDYLIENEKQILIHLEQLLTNNCLLSAHFGDNHSFLTTLVGIDAKNKTLEIDCGPTDFLNQHLLASGTSQFRSEMDGVKVSFTGKKISRAQHNDHSVFTMPIPDSLFWLQRRKFYRIKVPMSHDSCCELSFRDNTGTRQTATFKLHDISVTGFAFVDAVELPASHFLPNAEYVNCLVHLDNGETEPVDFVIKNAVPIRVSAMESKQRLGCAFTKISPQSESTILRYMQDLERQMRNLRTDD